MPIQIALDSINNSPGGSNLTFGGNSAREIRMETSSSDTPPSLTLRGADSAAGTNSWASDLILTTGAGTGNSVGATTGSIIFKTSPTGSSGSTRQTLTEAMRISQGGNVGIGTTGPNAKLEVAGGELMVRDDGYEPTIYLRATNNDHYAKIVARNSAGGGNQGDLAFFTEYNNIDVERVTILNTGNVGIGTTSPNRTLVLASTSGPNFELKRTGFSGYTYLEDDGTNSVYRSYGATIFQTSGASERMRIDSSGNVKLSTAGTKILNSSGNPILQQTGSVLQVVSQNYSTNFESSTNTFTDTGITVSITPTSATSKILVLITLSGVYKDGSNSLSGLQARLVRGSTTLQQFSNRAGFDQGATPNQIGGISFNYLDSPATTSSTTYKVQASNKESASKAAININGPDDSSSITLMEISA